MKSVLVLVPRLVVAILGFAAAAAGAQNVPQAPLPTLQLTAGIHVIQAEAAATPLQREIGLMGRRQLAPTGGMIFFFDEASTHCMWMRNTLIPLSVAFIDDDGTIANIEDMAPQTENPHCAVHPVRYALEMSKGWFAQRGFKAGARISGLPKR